VKLFEKAGEPGGNDYPVLYFIVMIKLSAGHGGGYCLCHSRHKPLVGIGIMIDFIKSFGNLASGTGSSILLRIYYCKMGFDKETNTGKICYSRIKEKHQKTLKKSSAREWIEAIIFAVVAATLYPYFFLLRPM